MTRGRTLAAASLVIVLSLALGGSGGVQAAGKAQGPRPNTPIEHFIVLLQDNHSFDNYFGTYPGAEGIPPGVCMPVDPFSSDNSTCVEPFHLAGKPIEDLDHSRDTFLRQYNNGHMDGFVYALRLRSQEGSDSMGYYDATEIPYYWNIAHEYVLFDHFFSSAAGSSVWNHMYWVAAHPGSEKGSIPREGYGDLPTIFDRLQERGISWKFYVQNYDPNLNYRSLYQVGLTRSQPVWVPLLSYDRFLDDPELSSHIVDLEEYYKDLQNDTLPAVAYLTPSGASERPPGNLRAGQAFVKRLLQALMQSKAWPSSAFMWSYDDWGGWYDHVPPPQVDRFGYGMRVPALLVSPYARRGYIDKNVHDFTSMPKFIEENWNLAPLTERDARAISIATAFDFSQPPRAPRFVSSVYRTGDTPSLPRQGVIYGAYLIALSLAGLIFWTAFDKELEEQSAPPPLFGRRTRR